MKKISFLAVAIFSLGLGSCKKSYTCECTTVDANGTFVSTREISKTSEKNAKAICGNSTGVYTSSFDSGSGTSYYYTYNSVSSCNLK